MSWPPTPSHRFIAFDAIVLRGFLFLGVVGAARWFPDHDVTLYGVAGVVWAFNVITWLALRNRASRAFEFVPIVHAIGWFLLATRSGFGGSPFILGFFLEIGLSSVRASATGTALTTVVGTIGLILLAFLDPTASGSRTAAVASGCVLLTGAVFSLLARQLGRARAQDEIQAQVALAAHRVKNSLTAAAGFAQLLDSDPRLDKPHRALALQVRSGITEAHQRLEELMKLPGSEGDIVSEIARVDLRAATERAVQACRALLDRGGIRCCVAVPAGIEVGIAAPAFHHVLLDLIQNSTEAMQPLGGGTLQIFAEHQSPTVLVVRDDGPGIPRRFSPGRTPGCTHRQGGHGLGLAGAQRLLRSYGASMRFGRAPGGRGTEVEIRLRSPSTGGTTDGGRRT